MLDDAVTQRLRWLRQSRLSLEVRTAVEHALRRRDQGRARLSNDLCAAGYRSMQVAFAATELALRRSRLFAQEERHRQLRRQLVEERRRVRRQRRRLQQTLRHEP